MDKDKKEYYYDQMAYDHQFYRFVVVHRVVGNHYSIIYYFWDEKYTEQYLKLLRLQSDTKTANIYKSPYTTFKDLRERAQGSTWESIVGNSKSEIVP